MSSTTPTTKTNNAFFSITNTGNKVFVYEANNIIFSITGTMSIGFDGVNFMPLTVGNHELYHVSAKTIYFSGTGTAIGFGLE